MATQDLKTLLSALRSAGSRSEQLKTLVRFWRLIRSLSSEERRFLARELGWEQAGDLLDQLGRKRGISPSALLAAVREMEKEKPGDLASLFADLKSRDRRAEALMKGLDLVAEAKAKSAGEGEEPASESSDSAAAEASSPPPPEGLPPPPPPAKVQELKETTQPAEPASERQALEDVEALVESEAEATPVVEVELVEPPEPTSPLPPHSQPETEEPATKSVAGRVTEREPPAPAGPPEEVIGIEPGEPAIERPGLMPQFRSLAALAEDSVAEPRELLSRFPEGWARRRALNLMLERGQMGSFEDAVQLIAELGSASDQFWCASTLARHWALDEEGQSRLCQALAPTAASRLRRRLARS